MDAVKIAALFIIFIMVFSAVATFGFQCSSYFHCICDVDKWNSR